MTAHARTIPQAESPDPATRARRGPATSPDQPTNTQTRATNDPRHPPACDPRGPTQHHFFRGLLGAGGAANDPRNLYPEPNYPGVSPDSYYQNPKDVLEDRLHDLVCGGRCRWRGRR